jgi:putative tryptophan/tyrosine transport system substrate-binding protein
MRRREFIAGLGSAAAWPMAARAQRSSTPVIGYLDSGSLETNRDRLAAVHRGLSEAGYVEGRNLVIEYRWAEFHYDRLATLADDLVRRQVAVIVAVGNTPSALAAKAATKSIPIVFVIGGDPVDTGLVASLSRPGGNLTGMALLISTVTTKRLEILRQSVPNSRLIALLVNPTDLVGAEFQTNAPQAAAPTLGVRLLILHASEPDKFDSAFETLVSERAGGLLVAGDAMFNSHFNQIVALAARYRVPAIYARRSATAAGGLMSYEPDISDAYRQAGTYAARILKAEKPADLPVQQVTKVELVIDLKTAKALGLTIPETLLATADEVIQ